MIRLPRNESKHIDWTLCFKCDHRIWPWPWPWPWIFKVKYEICYISTKSGPIATKQKANISIWALGLKCDNGFDFGHDIDIWIFKVICDLSGWDCQPWPSRSQNWMFVHSIIILSHSQQFPTSSSQNQVELGEWVTGHFMHCDLDHLVTKVRWKDLPGGEPTKLKCNYIRANVITFVQM